MLIAFSLTPLGIGEDVSEPVAAAVKISLVLKADIRPGVTDGLTSKVEKVERLLAEG